MDCDEKNGLLNDLIYPFGYTWEPDLDIISSTPDAWQRDFGYRAAFDRMAVHFNMVFHCQPVYFDYDGRTWLIEFWKGQYGINIGGEVGIYRADTIIPPEKYERTLFHSVTDEEMLPIRMDLLRGRHRIFSIERLHWWLTGFRMGEYCEPEELAMNVAITFTNAQMLQCFLYGLRLTGYDPQCVYISDRSVMIAFPAGERETCCRWKRCGIFARMSRAFSQWKNRRFCRIFLWITRPFTCTADRLLYLYYFIPFAFRRMLRVKRCRGWKYSKYKKHCRRRKCEQRDENERMSDRLDNDHWSGKNEGIRNDRRVENNANSDYASRRKNVPCQKCTPHCDNYDTCGNCDSCGNCDPCGHCDSCGNCEPCEHYDSCGNCEPCEHCDPCGNYDPCGNCNPHDNCDSCGNCNPHDNCDSCGNYCERRE